MTDPLNIYEAGLEYLDRQARKSHPQGHFVLGIFYPSVAETFECCKKIKPPKSSKFPWTYMHHCRTLKHVSYLYGVPEKELRKAIPTIKLLEKL